MRIHEPGTTGCDNECQDPVYQQSLWSFFEYISCISLMPHTCEKGRGDNSHNPVSYKEKAHRKVPGQWSSSSVAWFFVWFWFFFPQVLQIAPESGVVQPGGSIPCFITLRPSESASFYSIDLVCKVRPKRYTCITITSACHCSPQMAGPSSQLPAASSWSNPSLLCNAGQHFSLLMILSFIFPDALSISLSVWLTRWGVTMQNTALWVESSY